MLPTPLQETSKPQAMGGALLQDYMSGWESQMYEYDYYVDEAWVEGELPKELYNCTLCAGGPGLLNAYGAPVRSPSDADGMIWTLAVGPSGRPFFRNRFVRTGTFAAEQLAGRRLSRGLHDRGAPDGGLLFNPLDLGFRSAANAGVMSWGGKLYALSEHALPHEMNKNTLDTVGESTMGGLLQSPGALCPNFKVIPSTLCPPAPARAALPSSTARGQLPGREVLSLPGQGGAGQQGRVMGSAAGQRLVVMSSAQSGPDAAVTLLELGESEAVLGSTRYRVSSCIARTLTDFLVTDNYYVLLQPALSLNMQRLAARYSLGEVSFAECIDFEPDRPARLHLIPRPNSKAPARVLDVPPMVSPLGVNAFELDGGALLVVDLVGQEGSGAWRDMTTMMAGYYRGQPKPELTRLVVDVVGGGVASRVVSHRSVERGALVAPQRTGRPHKVLYAATSGNEDAENWGPPQVISKLHVPPTLGMPFAGLATSRTQGRGLASESWYPGPRCFVGAMMLVPKSGGQGEEDVWVVAMLHQSDTQKAELCILDGAAISSGPVCSVLLPHHLPYASNLHLVPSYLGPARAAPPGWKPRKTSGS